MYDIIFTICVLWLFVFVNMFNINFMTFIKTIK